MDNFFVRRPIVAMVISIFMVIVGLMILPFLFDQYIDFSQWFAEW